jgi:hypothetical protein
MVGKETKKNPKLERGKKKTKQETYVKGQGAMENIRKEGKGCRVLISFLIKGIQMGEISKLRWLIGLFMHAMWADSLLLSMCKILASFQDT